MDTISTGGTLATAMELYEKGLLKQEDLGEEAPPFRWGNTEVLHYYIEKIAKREGFGDKLAEGGYRLAKMYNGLEYFMGVKKQELPAYDPRGAEGHGLGYATNNRGGCHIKQYMISPEILGYPYKMDPHDISDEKVKMVILFQDLTHRCRRTLCLHHLRSRCGRLPRPAQRRSGLGPLDRGVPQDRRAHLERREALQPQGWTRPAQGGHPAEETA